ncbi:MAG: glutaredoxin family protein [Clostridiales bacterium]|nr:glutaredoxin family protein [Clostridiales bacterium]
MKNVVVYTSNTCGYCHAAMKFLDSMSVSYTEKNVSVDVEARKELIKKGFMGVPVIMIDDEVVQGFDKVRLQELLG